MSKGRSRQQKKRNRIQPREAKHQKLAIGCALLILILVAGVAARWRVTPGAGKLFAMAPTAGSFNPSSPSKEYVYAGGRLIATEEAGGTVSPTPTPTPGPTPTPTPGDEIQGTPLIVISQVYGGGGNSGASYKNDYIELFNRGDGIADLSGWSVQYSASGSSTWQVTQLSGTLSPGQYYLIQQAQGSGGTLDLPTPDSVGNDDLNATAGKVALVYHSTPLSGACPSGSGGIVDFVGYGNSAGCFEGTGPAPAPSNTNAIFRASSGCIDINDNTTDFDAGAPSPRNRTSAHHTCTAPTGSAGVVISEFRTRGPNGGFDEFIELYNKSGNSIDISGWKIKASNNAGTISVRVTIPANTILPAHGYYLVTNSNSAGYSGTVAGNQTYTTGISDDGGIALTTGTDQIVDQVGMSSGSAFIESRVLAPLTTNSDRSYERKPGGSSGSTQDTDDNRSDFQIRTPSDPQR
jgi:predicted extracellular nuclease